MRLQAKANIHTDRTLRSGLFNCAGSRASVRMSSVQWPGFTAAQCTVTSLAFSMFTGFYFEAVGIYTYFVVEDAQKSVEPKSLLFVLYETPLRAALHLTAGRAHCSTCQF